MDGAPVASTDNERLNKNTLLLHYIHRHQIT